MIFFFKLFFLLASLGFSFLKRKGELLLKQRMLRRSDFFFQAFFFLLFVYASFVTYGNANKLSATCKGFLIKSTFNLLSSSK